MSSNLDPFRPDEATLIAVRRELLDAGNAWEAIPHAWVAATIAAMQKWVTTSPAGAAYVTQLLGMSTYPGESDKDHYIVDGNAQVVDHVKPEDLQKVYGVIANGQFIHPAALRISDKSRAACDSCTILGPCVTEIVNPLSGRLQSLCNHCMAFSDIPQIRDEGSLSVCRSCTLSSCSHHPARTLRPPAATGY